jgi:hypothetical protein
MTRIQSLFAGVVASAIVALAPAANAQTGCGGVHFVGAGSSAQFLMAAIATDQAALNANSACYSSGNVVKHWTQKNGGYISDNRDSLGRITNETGNVALTWIEDATSGNATDAWFVISVDSTVGVRSVLAQETTASGDQVQITSSNGTTSSNLVSPNNLWPDNAADAVVDTTVLNLINTSVSGGVHVNVGLTDIRPEDALFATARSYAALDTVKWAGLGYVGPTKYIGAPILSGQPGSTSTATPIGFALPGKSDPISKKTVPSTFTTIPVGAAPIVFIANNNNVSTFPKNLVSGVTPDLHATGQTYPLERLFAGVVACDTDAAAFGGNDDGAGTPLVLFLREPLSGTMNTTEYSLFRSFGDNGPSSSNAAYGSQETGIVNPTRAPYNPLNLTCPTHGSRSRAIGTGEVVGASGKGGIIGTTNSLGYIFFGFANAAKFAVSGAPSPLYNYLTIDGVDPIGLPTTAQELPYCSNSTCPASLWTGSLSYPNIRNGSYKAWSIYRWVTDSTNSDPYGPAAVAQSAQDFVDSDVADFVPFHTSTGSDGLEVYRSHFTQEAVTANNGAATSANLLDGGNTLGGLTEGGGDEGGLIEGPFGTTVNPTTGYVTTSGTLTTGKGYKVTWKGGAHFTAGTGWEGGTITIGGANYTIASCSTCTLTTTTLYVTTTPGANTIAEAYSAPFATTFPAATTPGVTAKHQ